MSRNTTKIYRSLVVFTVGKKNKKKHAKCVHQHPLKSKDQTKKKEGRKKGKDGAGRRESRNPMSVDAVGAGYKTTAAV